MTTATSLRIPHESIKENIGTRVLLDKDALLSGDYASEISDLLTASGVLIFEQVHFTDEEQIRFTNTLGILEPELSAGEDVYKITLDQKENTLAGYLHGAFFWHFDGFMNEIPLRASMLSCKSLPADGKGGDTEFCNTNAAYKALPDDIKQRIDGLRATHALVATQLCFDPEPSYDRFMEWRAVGSRELPIVWRQPGDRRSLAIGNSALSVTGMDPLESKEMLVFLRDWATQERFRYRHRWAVGDTVIWDNTSTLHRATPYAADSGRLMHRTKLRGEHPIDA